jgi:hypothetical protein
MRIQIDEDFVTLTPFGSLARVNSINESRGGGKSWMDILRTALSQVGAKRHKNPAD